MDRYCPKCFAKFPPDVMKCPEHGTPTVVFADRDLVGESIDDRYRVSGRIGKGGMGVVYEATQLVVNRRVALKVLNRELVKDEVSVKRFLNEARAMASLRNQHTIMLYDFGATGDGLLFYTMERLDGETLSHIIRREGQLEHKRAVNLVLQACDSLEEAHEKEILHRDIKPDNLFIIQERKVGEFLKVLDFGIAKLRGDPSAESLTRTGFVAGTPAYLSPEQVLGGEPVPASDLYSLTIVLYEMLAGTPPFLATTPMRVLMMHVNAPPMPVSQKNPAVVIPRTLEEFIQRGLAKTPAERFASVAEYREALEHALRLHRSHPRSGTLPDLATTGQGNRVITDQMYKGAADKGPEETTAMDPAAGESRPRAASQAHGPVAEPAPQRQAPAGVAAADEGPHADSGADSLSQAFRQELDRRRRLLIWGAAGLVVVAALAIVAAVGTKSNEEGPQPEMDRKVAVSTPAAQESAVAGDVREVQTAGARDVVATRPEVHSAPAPPQPDVGSDADVRPGVDARPLRELPSEPDGKPDAASPLLPSPGERQALCSDASSLRDDADGLSARIEKLPQGVGGRQEWSKAASRLAAGARDLLARIGERGAAISDRGHLGREKDSLERLSEDLTQLEEWVKGEEEKLKPALLREADALEQKGDALRKELDALRGACKVLACKEPSVSEVGSALGELFGYCSDVPVAVRNGSWQSAEKDLDAARRRHSAAVVGIEGLKGQVEDADRWLAAYASLAADVDKLMKQLDWDRKKIGVVDVVRAKAEELLAQAKKLADDVGAGKAMVLRRELDKAAQELASLRKRYEQLVDVRNKFVK